MTCQIERVPSSETKSEPSLASATPTGRPQTCPSPIDESGEKILIFAGCVAVLHRQSNHFVAGALGAIPRAVLAGESVALELGRELRALVEDHLERSKVRVDDDIGRDDFGLQFGMLANVARILVSAHVPPRPAVEAAFLHVRHVVGHEVVAEAIALIG